MKRTIRVGLVQQSCTPDLKQNLEKLHRNIASVAQAGAQLVVLQELHNTPYFCQTEDTGLFDLAEPIPGPSTGFYSEIAAAYHIVLVTSLFERRAAGLYHNTAVVFDADGSIAGKYRKMHIPDRPRLLREVLLHSRRPGLRTHRDLSRQTGRAGMLGPVVS